MTLNRNTFYRRPDGREMTSQEMLSHLLTVGGLDSEEAALIARCAVSTIETYRKPSAKRPVPPSILRPLERHVLDRLTSIAAAAGYDLKPAA